MIKNGIKKPAFLLLLAALFLVLVACSNGNNETGGKTEETAHSNMNHSGSSEVPDGLMAAKNPKYEVGSQAIIESDHMEGMKGAEATIVGAYDTTVYTISYTPTDGGERVENHKWVIHEEFQDAGDEQFKPGSEIKINAEHMEGMDGVEAEIDSVEATTVYMVDFTTNDGEKVKNHKWVTESELSPVK
ncbi:YdhK family protein [Neobacillus niacini]|uniref:YdhK family protein n=1 Tax=Neobacillus niacini TaxID=86668 RepID=UPI002FFD63C7